MFSILINTTDLKTMLFISQNTVNFKFKWMVSKILLLQIIGKQLEEAYTALAFDSVIKIKIK